MSARPFAFGFVLLLVAACAAPTVRGPTAPPVHAAAGETTDGETDTDGDAEAEDEAPTATAGTEDTGPCPKNMALIEGRFCIDKYEASLVETAAEGGEQPFAHYLPVDGRVVRAVSEPGVFPQGYISEVQAADACAASGKRLCRHDEWLTACRGPANSTFPYGDARRPGACHDTGKSAVIAVFGAKAVAASTPAAVAPQGKPTGKVAHVTTKGRAAVTTKSKPPRGRVATARPAGVPKSLKVPRPAGKGKKPTGRAGKASARPASVDPGVWGKLNDPALGQVEGALAKTASHEECVNGFGVYDMVGNLHEWVTTDRADGHGVFAGGYYLDTTLNGDGCNYRTTAHAHDYHDYSTGFRCCQDKTD